MKSQLFSTFPYFFHVCGNPAKTSAVANGLLMVSELSREGNKNIMKFTYPFWNLCRKLYPYGNPDFLSGEYIFITCWKSYCSQWNIDDSGGHFHRKYILRENREKAENFFLS